MWNKLGLIAPLYWSGNSDHLSYVRISCLWLFHPLFRIMTRQSLDPDNGQSNHPWGSQHVQWSSPVWEKIYSAWTYNLHTVISHTISYPTVILCKHSFNPCSYTPQTVTICFLLSKLRMYEHVLVEVVVV